MYKVEIGICDIIKPVHRSSQSSTVTAVLLQRLSKLGFLDTYWVRISPGTFSVCVETRFRWLRWWTAWPSPFNHRSRAAPATTAESLSWSFGSWQTAVHWGGSYYRDKLTGDILLGIVKCCESVGSAWSYLWKECMCVCVCVCVCVSACVFVCV